MKKQFKQRQLLMVLLCSLAVVALVVTGGGLYWQSQMNDGVHIASAGQSQTVPTVLEQQPVTQEPEPEQEPANPYGVDPEKPMLALTFDDGPSKYTWEIVETLRSHNARATFFLLGNRVATHQAAIDNLLANHNQLGSHSFSHQKLTSLTEAQMVEQILPVEEALQKQHQVTTTVYRVPYGAQNAQVRAVLQKYDKPIIGWSVDPYDWKVKNKQKIVDHVLRSVQDGDIVLMHDIYGTTAEAVAELVPALQAQGYQLVTVEELFALRGYSLEAGQFYKRLGEPVVPKTG